MKEIILNILKMFNVFLFILQPSNSYIKVFKIYLVLLCWREVKVDWEQKQQKQNKFSNKVS